MSAKHLQKYIDEFADRTRVCHLDTMEQIKATVAGFVGKRLTCKDLAAQTQIDAFSAYCSPPYPLLASRR